MLNAKIRKWGVLAALMCCIGMTVTSCSTKKNTGLTRFWHGFTAQYNTYYNGSLAYIDASLEKEKGNKDNFTEIIPLYTVTNKGSRELGKSNYDKAITKAQKAIQLHSIKTKPEWTKSRKKTEKDLEWLSRKEYNPFLWKAWMLMGRSQFYQGGFDEAAVTFAYMARLYKGQPAIYGKARAWLAKCYIESGWIYDAEDVIHSMQRDSLDWRAVKEWDYTLCDYYLHTGNYPKTAEYLRKVIRHEMRSKQKAREYFLLGQIEAAQGHREEAYRAFRKVLAQNPPYELAFNARIAMTEVMAKGQAKKMIGKLRSMARDENNKEYLDQVYYAIGNIYLAEKDTMAAIDAYEKGNEKATRTGIEKGVLLLHLGDLYWQKEKYGDAQRVYTDALGMLDKDRDGYKQLESRSKVLDELVPYTDAIQLQDSLQILAKLPEKERNAAIDRVIDALKKKEKEEAKKEAEKEAETRKQKYGNNNNRRDDAPKPAMPSAGGRRNSAWYFYNAQAVQQGKQQFQRTWGKRDNTDDWQRQNKTVVNDLFAEDRAEAEKAAEALANMTPEQRDSMMAAEQKQAEEKADTAANDPHKREYYMAQIPFTEEQVAESNEIIKDGLFHSGIIFKDKLDNLPLSEKAFDRLRREFPGFESMDEVYYHLFLLHSRRNEGARAQTYIDLLKKNHPDSKWTTILTDPYFAENALYGKHIEDSVYAATYEAFKADRFEEVYGNAEVSAKRFPMGENRDRFIFIEGLTRLNDGDAESCVKAMETVVKEYPRSVVAEMAGMIINGVRGGKALHGAKFDLEDVWNRRNVVMEDMEKYAERTFSDNKDVDHLFAVAYAPDSLDQNRLLFNIARFNFTTFMARSFDIDIEDHHGMQHMTVRGFRNFDEARQYAKVLLQQESVSSVIGSNGRPIVISNENLELIGTKYSYNDYDTFYVAHFAALPVERAEALYDEVTTVTEGADGAQDDDPVKAALPTEEVAPKGVKPVEPGKVAEEETDEEEAYGETGGVDGDVDGDVDGNSIAVDMDDNTSATTIEESIEVPAEEGNAATIEESIEVPAEEGNAATVEESIEVPAEEEVTGSEVGGDAIIMEDDSQNTVVDDGDAIIMEDNDEADAADDGDAIIMEEEKKSTKDLEDEYFELDGF